MKHLLLLLPLTLASVSVQAQQVNQYGVCTQYQEVYVPGGYDQYGNYYPGGVQTQSYNVPCGNMNAGYGGNNYYRPRVCNPTAGALLGAGIAGAIAGGSSRSYSGNWYNTYSRDGSSGGWSNTEKNNYSWQTLGAGLGALMFGC